MFAEVLVLVQFLFSAIVGIYFFTLLKKQQNTKSAVIKNSKEELAKLRKLRSISLTKPLNEETRPSSFDEIVGQEDGILALRTLLCSRNPQHIIIYGPPGVGKTAAARIALKEAVNSPFSPFSQDAKFIETDATTMRFDERSIADPLIGSVHDPIYQGAGAYGQAGIPQPKPGAVTKAHGGVLFIDEIGELHPIQLNKLLKVLEDRKVFLESAYYSPDDKNIPPHIHDIFKNGLPADFRLIGATTRSPEEIPPAIRSRCAEVFFKPLTMEDIRKIAQNAARKCGVPCEEECFDLIANYAQNGREAVNMIQSAFSLAMLKGRMKITKPDIEWVIETGRYSPRIIKKTRGNMQIGVVNALAVAGHSAGLMTEIEVLAKPAPSKKGSVKISGLIEKEELETKNRKLTRTSTAKSSFDNCLTVLKYKFNVDIESYDICINFPGGMPVDGPSAGISMFCALYSAIFNLPVSDTVAMTGEITINGNIKAVGGVVSKICAAIESGVKVIYIPKENYQEKFKEYKAKIVPVSNVFELIPQVFSNNLNAIIGECKFGNDDVISASGA